MGAVFAPGLGDRLQFGVGGFAALGPEVGGHGPHLGQRQAQAAGPAEDGEIVVGAAPHGQQIDARGLGLGVGEGRFQQSLGPPLHHLVVEHAGGQGGQLGVVEAAGDHQPAGHRGGVDVEAEFPGGPGQFGPLPIGHAGPEPDLHHPLAVRGQLVEVLARRHPPLSHGIGEQDPGQTVEVVEAEIALQMEQAVPLDLIDGESEQAGLGQRSVVAGVDMAGAHDDGRNRGSEGPRGPVIGCGHPLSMSGQGADAGDLVVFALLTVGDAPRTTRHGAAPRSRAIVARPGAVDRVGPMSRSR